VDETLEANLREYEKIQIRRALEEAAGDKKRTADHLGLSLSTLYRKLERLGIDN
jgi:transcriptional regulator with PAS, ATPase and Fis domain